MGGVVLTAPYTEPLPPPLEVRTPRLPDQGRETHLKLDWWPPYALMPSILWTRLYFNNAFNFFFSFVISSQLCWVIATNFICKRIWTAENGRVKANTWPFSSPQEGCMWRWDGAELATFTPHMLCGAVGAARAPGYPRTRGTTEMWGAPGGVGCPRVGVMDAAATPPPPSVSSPASPPSSFIVNTWKPITCFKT